LFTDVGGKGFGEGSEIASLANPTKESVQTITLRKDTKARFVTLDLKRRNAILKFREVEIYNGPLGNSPNYCEIIFFRLLLLLRCGKNTA